MIRIVSFESLLAPLGELDTAPGAEVRGIAASLPVAAPRVPCPARSRARPPPPQPSLDSSNSDASTRLDALGLSLLFEHEEDTAHQAPPAAAPAATAPRAPAPAPPAAPPAPPAPRPFGLRLDAAAVAAAWALRGAVFALPRAHAAAALRRAAADPDFAPPAAPDLSLLLAPPAAPRAPKKRPPSHRTAPAGGRARRACRGGDKRPRFKGRFVRREELEALAAAAARAGGGGGAPAPAPPAFPGALDFGAYAPLHLL
jgi:hypothetical protein